MTRDGGPAERAVHAPLTGRRRAGPAALGRPDADRVALPPSVGPRIGRARSLGGRALTAHERAPFERRLGVDLGEVRIHTGARATYLADALGARAFTVGADVFFADGELDRGARGRALLGHELAHAVQQRNTAPVVQRAPRRDSKTCDSRSSRLNSAFEEAPRWLRQAIASLDDPAAIAGPLREHFGILVSPEGAVSLTPKVEKNAPTLILVGEQTPIELLKYDLQRLLEGAQEDFVVFCASGKDCKASVEGANKRAFYRRNEDRIYFCESGFHRSIADTTSVLIHELAHKVLNLDDKAYKDLGGDYPSDEPFSNADSYQNFVEDVVNAIAERNRLTTVRPSLALGAVGGGPGVVAAFDIVSRKRRLLAPFGGLMLALDSDGDLAVLGRGGVELSLGKRGAIGASLLAGKETQLASERKDLADPKLLGVGLGARFQVLGSVDLTAEALFLRAFGDAESRRRLSFTLGVAKRF